MGLEFGDRVSCWRLIVGEEVRVSRTSSSAASAPAPLPSLPSLPGLAHLHSATGQLGGVKAQFEMHLVRGGVSG